MRELVIAIAFVRHCLGNVKEQSAFGRFFLPRDLRGSVTFLPSWHHANLRFAAQVLNRYQDSVGKIAWDLAVEGCVRDDCWYRRYYRTGANGNTRVRYVLHEAFCPGQTIRISCAVPAQIPNEGLEQLMGLAGKYRGLSPWKPGEFGFFEVVEIDPVT